MNIAVIGLGLIGGSMCRAFKKYCSHTVIGMDNNKETISAAIADGSIIKEAKAADLGGCDLTIVALWPDLAIKFIEDNARFFKAGAIVADVCGIKGDIVDSAGRALSPYKVNFIGTHPMAGVEFSGYAHSFADLFQNASLLITPYIGVPEAAISSLEDIMAGIGFGKILRTAPKEHDEIIAFTSQLAHIVSNAYVKSPTINKRSGFSAGSFLDMTRVAKLDEFMWTSLFLHNKQPLLFELDVLIKNLSEYREAIASSDTARLQKLLKDGRVIKENS